VRSFFRKKSGENKEKPELEKLLGKIRTGDTVVVWKLDRVDRLLLDFIDLMAGFRNKGVNFISLQDGINITTSHGRCTFNIFASLAEFER